MKKLLCKTLTALLILSMIVTIPSFIVSADAYPTGFETGFESFSLDSNSRFVLENEVTGASDTSVQFNQNSGTGSWTVGSDPLEGGIRGNNLKVVVPESGASPQINLHTIVDRSCTFGVSFYITDGISINVSAKGNGNSWDTGVQNVFRASNGTLKIMSNNEADAVEELQTGWYDVRISFDYEDYKLYIHVARPDGIVTTYTKALNSKSEGIHYLNIATGLGADVMIDDLSMYYWDDPAFDIAYEKIIGGEMSYDVDFTQDVVCADKTAFVEFFEGETALAPSVTPKFNNSYMTGFTLSFSEALEARTAYSFKLTGITDLFAKSVDGTYIITMGEREVELKNKFLNSAIPVCTTEQQLSYTIDTLNTSGNEKSVYILNGGEAAEFEDEFSVYPKEGMNTLTVELRDEEGATLAVSETVEFIGEALTTTEVLTDDDFETGGRTLPIKTQGRRDDEYKNNAYAGVTGKEDENEYIKLDSYKDPNGSVGSTLSYMQTADAKSSASASHGDFDKIVSYEADYSLADFNAEREILRFKIYKDDTYAANVYTYAFKADTVGGLYINSYSGENQILIPLDVPALKINTWYSFRVDYDLAEHSADMYFEDVCVARGVQLLKSSMSNGYNYAGYLNCNTGTPVENDTVTAIRLDNVYERYIARDEFEVVKLNHSAYTDATGIIVHDGAEKEVRFFTAIYADDKLVGITFSDISLGSERVAEVSNSVPDFTAGEGVTYQTKSFFWDGKTLKPY